MFGTENQENYIHNLNQLGILKYQVLSDDIDESELGPETLQMRERYRAKSVSNFSGSFSEETKLTVEEMAASYNRLDTWLDDPYNNLISSIGGKKFLFKDTLMCLKERCQVISDQSDPDYPFKPSPLSKDEERHVRDLEEIVSFLTDIEEKIQQLKTDAQKT